MFIKIDKIIQTWFYKSVFFSTESSRGKHFNCEQNFRSEIDICSQYIYILFYCALYLVSQTHLSSLQNVLAKAKFTSPIFILYNSDLFWQSKYILSLNKISIEGCSFWYGTFRIIILIVLIFVTRMYTVAEWI